MVQELLISATYPRFHIEISFQSFRCNATKSFQYTLSVNHKVYSDICSKNSTILYSYQYRWCYKGFGWEEGEKWRIFSRKFWWRTSYSLLNYWREIIDSKYMGQNIDTTIYTSRYVSELIWKFSNRSLNYFFYWIPKRKKVGPQSYFLAAWNC